MKGPLSEIRVVDLTDERAIYGAKLLADLGADVVRLEPPEGDPLRHRGPSKDDISLWHLFFASNRRFFSIDLDTDQATLASILEKTDILLTSRDGFGADVIDFDTVEADHPELIIIDTTPFGREGPWKEFSAPDLVAGALAGAVATTGDVDTPPLKPFGELNFMVSGVYVAIAALAALFEKRHSGRGQRVDVSVHECIASCLEQVLMFYWYHDRLQREPVLPRRGALHWSDAYAVFPTSDGAVMMTPTPDFDNQLVWLIEEGVAENLLDPKYQEPEFLRERTHKTMDIMKRWALTKEAEPFFHEAQARHSPYGWVIPIGKMVENQQLEARMWFREYEVDGKTIKGPGAPYVFSQTPWRTGTYDTTPGAIDEILSDIGWGEPS